MTKNTSKSAPLEKEKKRKHQNLEREAGLDNSCSYGKLSLWRGLLLKFRIRNFNLLRGKILIPQRARVRVYDAEYRSSLN